MLYLKRLPIIVLIFISSILLCGCPPIKYKFFIRNTTTNTVHLTLKLNGDTIKNKVRSKKELIKINNKTSFQLNDSLMAFSDDKSIQLNIPMKSTVFMNDFLGMPFIVQNKILFIQNGNKIDSLKLDYPYRKNKVLKRKRGELPDDLFYRTIIYYDIK